MTDSDDYIFIDMPTDLRLNLIPILTECDQIFLVYTPDLKSIVKAKKFFGDILMIQSREKIDLISKIKKIENMN